MAAQPSPAAAARRLRTTPYARRLARERGLALDAVAGSGPDGRITGADIFAFKAPEPAIAAAGAEPRGEPMVQAEPVAAVVAPAAMSPAAVPSALSTAASFSPALELLAQIGSMAITHEEIVLKAASGLLQHLQADAERALSVLAGKQATRLAGLSHASLSGIAALRRDAADGGTATLSVSFLAKAGVRPVAARLVGDAPARLLVGFPDKHGEAELLLSYDPDRIADEPAAEFLHALRDGIETPLRLLV